MKLIGYTCAFNEAEYVPYIMPYVERMGYDKFIVYDNNSTDNTVELLSQYPFVEIRKFNEDGVFTNERKRDIQLEGYMECYRMTGSENVWMTFTDFDEVIFNPTFNGDTFKLQLANYTTFLPNEFNCLCKRMINIFPKEETSCDELKLDLKKYKYPHAIPGVRGNLWEMGDKPLVIKVNDFPYIEATQGNHWMNARLRENVTLGGIDKVMPVYAFHLKYFDKDILKKKTKSYYGKGRYKGIYDNLQEIYNTLYSTSFPLETYFCAEALNFPNRGGIRLINE